MNRYEDYETSNHRIAFGSAAVALTVLGLGLLLVVPATIAPSTHESHPAASSQAAAAANEGDGRLRVEVIAVREPHVVATQVRTQAKRRQEG
jgi:hypothetical protein